MNCLEFRRRLGSEPSCTLVDFAAHRAACSFCWAAHARAEEFELRVQRALGVPVPVNLADRILLAQTTQFRHGTRHRRRGFAAFAVAAAASIIVALIALNGPAGTMPELSAMVAEHLEEHVVDADDAGRRVANEDVVGAFAGRGLGLTVVPDGINYVHQCPAGPYRTVHMVMPDSSGPVSVVYVVDRKADKRVDFRSDGMRGRELPLGDGSLVMLAQSDAGFDAIEGAWRSAMAESVALAADPDARLAAIVEIVQNVRAVGRPLAAP